jgi:hypothetical protein
LISSACGKKNKINEKNIKEDKPKRRETKKKINQKEEKPEQQTKRTAVVRDVQKCLFLVSFVEVSFCVLCFFCVFFLCFLKGFFTCFFLFYLFVRASAVC